MCDTSLFYFGLTRLFKMLEESNIKLMVSGTCFWSLDAIFSSLRGVSNVECGWAWMAGGFPPRESVDRHPFERMEIIVFDWNPSHLSARTIVEVLIAMTSPQLQNWEVLCEMSGLRSLIAGVPPMFRNEFERTLERVRVERAQAAIPVATHTQIMEMLPSWMRAPASDQQYFVCKPSDPFCVSMIEPKLLKLKNIFSAVQRASPHLPG